MFLLLVQVPPREVNAGQRCSSLPAYASSSARAVSAHSSRRAQRGARACLLHGLVALAQELQLVQLERVLVLGQLQLQLTLSQLLDALVLRAPRSCWRAAQLCDFILLAW